ncbi:Oidioi.mRNA.OKI2018_I69.PAR.g8891.t1.cds [Oikopleura dioica]|uniref:Oidioi.mRNA.OKI2018_I69.PAR.g8891.t1.cds n=1 Tax=Oikopleura dioica TaxID=34765 RepID=A0ABN7RI46_OIKDI|nr:Oidioi.mRNA.OKI2018_I69.PAR.g8891.t1.cds [Oikopleura dioica]
MKFFSTLSIIFAISLFVIIGLWRVGLKWNPKIIELQGMNEEVSQRIIELNASLENATNENDNINILFNNANKEIQELKETNKNLENDIKFFMSQKESIMILASSKSSSISYLLKEDGTYLSVAEHLSLPARGEIVGYEYQLSALIRGEIYIFGGLSISRLNIFEIEEMHGYAAILLYSINHQSSITSIDNGNAAMICNISYVSRNLP